MKKTILLSLFVTFTLFCFPQQIPYHLTPDWESTPDGRRSTGLGLADINGDGWKDMIVADGNDMARQGLTVYYNNGDGTFPHTPDWESNDIDYHGHLAVGDLNNDGWFDVAVSVYIGAGGFSDPGYFKIYYNQEGELEGTPSFVSQEFYTFSCAMGDADGDGDLDIGLACGEPYGNVLDYGRIYYNEQGSFSDDNIWESSIQMGSLDVEFGDIDLNGFLDIVFVCEGTANTIYLADDDGNITNTPSWQSTDPANYINSVDIGLIYSDTSIYTILVMTGNDQLGGDGKVKAYEFPEFPAPTTPYWSSLPFGYGSGIILNHVVEDDHLDLIYGGWWKPMKIAVGQDDGFELNTSYTSSTNSVVEAILISDLGKESIQTGEAEYNIEKEKAILMLPMQVTEGIVSVEVNDNLLDPVWYKHIPGKNWITFSIRLMPGETVTINYTYSPHGDIVISNWDSSKGNYIFYNTSSPIGIEDVSSGTGGNKLKVYPVPAKEEINIEINPNKPVEISIYNQAGILLMRSSYASGQERVKFDVSSLPNGFYYVEVKYKHTIVFNTVIINR